MKREQRQQVELPTAQPVFIDPRITGDPNYMAGIRARLSKVGVLPKSQEPVAGGPAPSIPRLDQEPVRGRTMADQAQKPVQMGQVGIVELPNRPAEMSPAQMGIMPIDTLPEQAQSDPEFQTGHGAMYASAQPKLALKYGVHRNGQFIPPQKLRPQAKGLRDETVRDMETLAKLQEQQRGGSKVGGLHDTEDEAAATVSDSAAAAARAGNVPGDTNEKPLSAEERKKVESSIDKMDEFDLDTFRQAMMRDILNNPEQKDTIEKKLTPLSIEDLILHNRVTQRVPIVPKNFEPTFQSMTAEEDLALKRLIMQESKAVEVSDRYLLDKYSFMSIAVGLKEINGKPIGDHLDEHGLFDEKKFWAKFNRITKLPLHMVASIGVNLFWFEQRVRKLFVAEKVGNG